MRILASIAAGVFGAGFYRTQQRSNDAHAFKGVNNAMQFRNKRRPGQVFSQRYEHYQLGEIVPVTSDVALFRFLLHDGDDEFNLKPCSTLQACYKYGVQPTDQCQRFYTPVTSNHTKGFFDLIVKRKQGGKMTDHLFGMHVGDSLLFRSVSFKIQYRPNRWRHVGMIAGGTGFTPMLQIIRHGLLEKWDSGVTDKTKLSLLFCNRTEQHILLQGVFDQLARDYASRFRVFYTIDLPIDEKEWRKAPNHFLGYVNHDMIRASMPAPAEKNKIIMICGPDQLLSHVAGTPMAAMATMSSGLHIQPMGVDMNNLVILGGLLADLGYDNDDVYRF